jgi:hypothetical protein
MRPEIASEVMGPYIASNTFGVVTIACACSWPRATRALFAALFLGASLVSAWAALIQPVVYMNFGASAMTSGAVSGRSGISAGHRAARIHLV